MTDENYRFVFFPKNHCGPDLLFRLCNGGRRTVAIQCKMHSVINSKRKCPFALAKFNKTLLSLHPAHYFESKKKDGFDEHRTIERDRWQELVGDGYRHLEQFSAFHRIVFVALGFTLHVQYLVCECNARQPLGSQKLIHLLNLYDLKDQVDQANYAILENLVKDETGKLNIQAHETVTLQSKWMSRSMEQKALTSYEELRWLCDHDQRDINVTKEVFSKNGNKYSKAKTRDELVNGLDNFNIKEVLDDLKWDLLP